MPMTTTIFYLGQHRLVRCCLYRLQGLDEKLFGIARSSSPQDALFACPADTFCYPDNIGSAPLACHLLSAYNYSSYVFNAGNIRKDYPFTNGFPALRP